MARTPAAPKKPKPVRRPKKATPPEQGDNPSAREDQFLSERLAPLAPKGGPTLPPLIRERGGFGPADAEPPPPPSRRDLLEEYRTRKSSRQTPPSPSTPREAFGHGEDEQPGGSREAPAPPPAQNWIPIGPSVVRQGQGGTKPATGGRTPAIAVAPGGQRVYVGAANGGVWRSDDAGRSWRSLMDAFDLNPTTPASDSLAVGALAIDPGNPDRVYVGSGEGAGAAYFGVGPIVTSNGGDPAPTWMTEPVAPGSDPLAGAAFFALAVDPADPSRVVAATTVGLYRREPDGAGGFHWAQKAVAGATRQRATSVVAAANGGTTTFFAAVQGGPVFRSNDGSAWTVAGAGFPAGAGRICLGCQSDNPNLTYALASTGAVLRLDAATGTWRAIAGVPADLLGNQGWYDLAIAVAPDNPNRIYLGGSTIFSGGDWSGSAYRSEVTVGPGGPRMTATYIGGSVHADVHTLAFAPGDPNSLWLGCDGGVFHSESPATGDGGFVARNLGYQTLMMEHLGQHPTEEAVLFCGTQDNGCLRYTGEEAWLYSAGGDGGFVLVNWRDPYKILSSYVEGTLRRSTNGGQRYAYDDASVPLAGGDSPLFYAPMAGTPPNPASATADADANLVAFGSVRPWISPDFGRTWRSIPNNALSQDTLGAQIRSLAFASPGRLYAGTTQGGVWRFDRAGGAWTRTQIDTLGGGNQLPLSGAVTDIAVDPANPDRVFVTMGGTGDFRHVWHFDGARWQARSGPAAGNPNSLLDTQANAIAIDPADPNTIYVGADIGVWRSTDGGLNWQTWSDGLPDAGVMDLALHNPKRALRAATHGRGVWERDLTGRTARGVELVVRRTQLDSGRFAVVSGLPDPTRPGEFSLAWESPDIKIDTPDATGQLQFPAGEIDFLQFVDTLNDDFRGATPKVSRVYVQVHNRGVTPADGARVMLLIANASAGLPPLPAGYDAQVRNGLPINTPGWHTVGLATLGEVRAGHPRVAAFELPASLMPPPLGFAGSRHYCLLALVHHPADSFDTTETAVQALTPNDRKTAQKNLTIAAFGAGAPKPIVIPVRINPSGAAGASVTARLRLDLSRYPGRVRVIVPGAEGGGSRAAAADMTDFKAWARAQKTALSRSQRGAAPGNKEWSEQRLADLERVEKGAQMLEPARGLRGLAAEAGELALGPGGYQTVYLICDPPARARSGQHFAIGVEQLDEAGRTAGGLTVSVVRA